MCLWASRLYLWFKGNPVGALLSVLHPEAFHRLAQCMSLDISHGLGTVLAWAYCRWNSDYLVTCPQLTTFTEVRQTINEMSRKNTLYIRNASKKKKIRRRQTGTMGWGRLLKREVGESFSEKATCQQRPEDVSEMCR